jgi:hypothetical protein
VYEEEVFFCGFLRLQDTILLRSHPEKSLIDEPVFLQGENMITEVDHPVIFAVDKLEREFSPTEEHRTLQKTYHERLVISKNKE